MTMKKTASRRGLVGALALAWSMAFVFTLDATAAQSDESGSGFMEYREPAVPMNGSKGFDAVVVRPVTFFTSLVSASVFVISLPFTAFDPAIGAGKARENLVSYPFNDTFRRPLGDLDGMDEPAGNPSTWQSGEQ